jgi:uncharacterized protein YndB with AHSA1/START domain
MSSRENYQPGPAAGAEIRKDEENWTLVLVRELRHPPTKVWEAVSETRVTRADAPKLLEYQWGDGDMRWQLEPLGAGTRLTLWHNIDRRFISWGAAGWHICFDVLDRLLAGEPIGRIVGPEAMKFDGWQRLTAEYAKQFGV